MTHEQTKSYIVALSGFLDKYNNAPHTSLGGMTPLEAWQFPSEARDYHYSRIQKAMTGKTKSNDITVGTWVRVLNLKGVFDKGYHVKYSLTPHKVVEINGLNYILDNGKIFLCYKLVDLLP